MSMTEDVLVFDADVLIASYNADWFDHLEFWADSYELLTAKAVWEDEFILRRQIKRAPVWLSTPEIEVEQQPPGQVSRYDWRGLRLAEKEGGILITSDGDLREQAEQRGIEKKWTAGFLMETFERCGIPEEEYRAGLDNLVTDLYLGPSVKNDLSTAEKD